MFISKFHFLRWMFPTFPNKLSIPVSAFPGTSWNAHQTSLMECQHEDLRAARSAHLRTPSPGAELWDSDPRCSNTMYQDLGPRGHWAKTPRGGPSYRLVLHVWKSSLPWSTFAYTYITSVSLHYCIWRICLQLQYVFCYYVYSPSTCICRSPSKSLSPKFDPIYPLKVLLKTIGFWLPYNFSCEAFQKANIADLQNFCKEGWLIPKKLVHIGDPKNHGCFLAKCSAWRFVLPHFEQT